MSGGSFDYRQYEIEEIKDQIEELIYKNYSGPGETHGFDENTIQRFREAVEYLKLAKVYVNSIDYLVSGDDGEQTFHERLQEDLEEIVD